ncbi:hypothetical protein Glove_476g25 [Diversispora epigaea]|uniref:Retrotransposon gag domain-containing protein n=1 Tax=Diversispora epigaea TaxID=1348612 RepID=A0A397GKV1_9GLOM|nr:hypothetical protein Glove_476g25 [Diversispora epigaea]
MVIAKRRNDCVDEAIKQKNEALSEIVKRELSREEKDPNYEVTYTLKDLNRVKDHLDLIKHHVWIRDNILVDNGRTVFNIPTRENQNPVTVRLPASNSTTTSPSATVETSETTPRQRRRSNETPQSFSQAVSPRQSPEQVTPRVVTPPNNWDQLQNIRTFYQPIDFNLLNQQLAETRLTASDSSDSSDTDTEDEMANAVLDYLEDNLYNHTSLRVDPFYGDGTQAPLQWMLHFEKVARSNAWDEAKKIRKYATYLEDDAEEWHDEINANDMADWAAWRAGFVEKYCNTRWRNKWMRELENNRQRQGETVDAYYATPRQRRRSNETPQSFSQAVSPRQSPEQVTPRVVTPPNNWDQLQNIRTFYQPIDFNLLNQQLAETRLTASDSSDSSDTDTEDEMANAVLDYLEDNLYNHTSLRVDPFYGDGTQAPLQWMLHFEKVARSNAWDEAKKIRKYATYLEDDAEEWHDEINANDMADWAAWRAGFVEKYCNTRWRNKWMRELENNRQRQGETVDAYYARFRRLVKRVEINVNQHKRLFIKGLLPHIAPLITMQAPGTLAAALELAQAYEEGLDMVNEIEPRKQKGKKKIVESSDEEEEEEEEERKPKKTVLKKKKKETKVTFDPAHNLDDLAKKFEKMQLNLIQKMEKLTTQVNQQPNYRNRGNNRDNSSQNNWNNRNNRNNRNNNRETRTCFKCGKEGHISWDYPDRKDNSDNSAHAKLVEVEEESEKEEDKLLQHLLEAYDAYLGKRKRDDSSDEDTPIKRPRETNIPEPKLSLNTFGLPKTTSVPVPKVVKTEITPKKKSKKKEVIKMVKGNKEKKKENATRPPLFRKKDFDIVE